MKTIDSRQEGSVLVIAILMITILTLICATTLQVTTQNAGANMQAASWQQALTGAEAGVDAAMNALNTNTAVAWTNWTQYAGSPTGFIAPPASASPTPTAATQAPDSAHFNYLPTASSRSLHLAGEGNDTVGIWVTVDTAGMSAYNGGQPYRIRATATALVPGLSRVSNQKLDNDLRNLSLRWDRKTNAAVSSPQVSRRIEVIAAPQFNSPFHYALLMANSVTMNGGSYIDSFNSKDTLDFPGGLYTNAAWLSALQNPAPAFGVISLESGNVATNNSTNSNLNGMNVYGNLAYSGPTVAGTSNVQGSISTPFNVPIQPTSDPTQLFGGTSVSSDLPLSVTATGTAQSPTLYKFNNLTVHDNIQINAPSPSPGQPAQTYYVTIWVTGTLKINGNATITQAPNVQVTYYLDNGTTINGGALVNPGLAQNLQIIGVGSNQTFKLNGGAPFSGTVNAPGWDITLSGSGDFSGAFVGNTMTMTGGARVHYDLALQDIYPGGASNYSYASWFEDTADPTHKALALDGVYHPIIY